MKHWQALELWGWFRLANLRCFKPYILFTKSFPKGLRFPINCCHRLWMLGKVLPSEWSQKPNTRKRWQIFGYETGKIRFPRKSNITLANARRDKACERGDFSCHNRCECHRLIWKVNSAFQWLHPTNRIGGSFRRLHSFFYKVYAVGLSKSFEIQRSGQRSFLALIALASIQRLL